jgi:hypothetical protein
VDCRNKAKQTVFAIYNYGTDPEFEKLIQKSVQPNEVRVLKDLILKMKKEMTVAKSGSNEDYERSESPKAEVLTSPKEPMKVSQIAK